MTTTDGSTPKSVGSQRSKHHEDFASAVSGPVDEVAKVLRCARLQP